MNTSSVMSIAGVTPMPATEKRARVKQAERAVQADGSKRVRKTKKVRLIRFFKRRNESVKLNISIAKITTAYPLMPIKGIRINTSKTERAASAMFTTME